MTFKRSTSPSGGARAWDHVQARQVTLLRRLKSDCTINNALVVYQCPARQDRVGICLVGRLRRLDSIPDFDGG